MTMIRPGLCLALVVLCAAASTTVSAQERKGDSDQTMSKAPILKLHGVTLGTKIKWGAQLLLYPEAIKPVRVLHAYKRDTVCKDSHQTKPDPNLGFVVVSSAQEGGPLKTGRLIGAPDSNKQVTLRTACDSSKNLSDADTNKTKYLLTLYGLQNQKDGALYWTDISSAPTTYAEILTKTSK